MPEENVELARAFFTAFNAWDAYGCDRLLASGAEVVTVTERAGLAQAGWAQGESERYFERLGETWADLRIEIDDYRDLDDRVLALGRMRGTGKSSRALVEGPFAAVFAIRDGRFAWVESYGDWGEAVKAAGLS